MRDHDECKDERITRPEAHDKERAHQRPERQHEDGKGGECPDVCLAQGQLIRDGRRQWGCDQYGQAHVKPREPQQGEDTKIRKAVFIP